MTPSQFLALPRFVMGMSAVALCVTNVGSTEVGLCLLLLLTGENFFNIGERMEEPDEP